MSCAMMHCIFLLARIIMRNELFQGVVYWMVSHIFRMLYYMQERIGPKYATAHNKL